MEIKLIDLIYHKKTFLSKEECNFLIDESNKRYKEYYSEVSLDSNTGIQTQSSFKALNLKIGSEGWKIVHTNTEKIINEYHDFLDSFKSFHHGFRKALNYSHLYRLLRYDVGCKIQQHIDHDPYVYASCSFNLNDNYTGGDFVWFKGNHRLKLGAGDAIIWPADYFWVHEVEPIISGIRYSTNSFLQEIPECLKCELYNVRDNLEKNIPNAPHIKKQFGAKYNINMNKNR